jgi:hypothetical protein
MLAYRAIQAMIFTERVRCWHWQHEACNSLALVCKCAATVVANLAAACCTPDSSNQACIVPASCTVASLHTVQALSLTSLSVFSAVIRVTAAAMAPVAPLARRLTKKLVSAPARVATERCRLRRHGRIGALPLTRLAAARGRVFCAASMIACSHHDSRQLSGGTWTAMPQRDTIP